MTAQEKEAGNSLLRYSDLQTTFTITSVCVKKMWMPLRFNIRILVIGVAMMLSNIAMSVMEIIKKHLKKVGNCL